MDIRLIWFYRLGFLLLLFIVMYIFLKLQDLWMPVLHLLITVAIPFFVAAFITYLLHPVIESLHEKGLHRGLAVFIIYSLFFGGIAFALYKGIPAFISQLRDLSENAPNLTNQYRNWVELIQQKTSTWPDGIQQKIHDGINGVEKALNGLVSKALDGAVNVLNSIVIIAIIPFIAFYMLKDFDTMKKAVWYLTPRKWRKDGILFLRDVDKSLGSYIRGQLFVCVVIGGISALLFWLVKLKYALLLGVFVGITNVIPYFGPIFGAIPAVVIASTISVKMVLISLGIILLLQFLEGNILSPLIVGKSLHMHPLLIMFALLIGGEIAGVIGLILAVPVLAVVKVALLHGRNHFGKVKPDSHSLKP
ncbi:AI-2E family transporter [Cytobacillus spongiae]|uniref:AI-2E family transporter n=1 Tax=Cytobacillus spongiae TaxID=2901381 RepID=UPI001F217B82|nr:AI-2E family transporter [Cytobacillus spongiae]UII54979.1 AI-2E family transporter [Cytobacillus spongiae]